MQILIWLLTVISLIGVVLNIHHRKECFYLWILTNGAWAWHNLIIKEYQQSFLFLIYFMLAIYGVIKWKKD